LMHDFFGFITVLKDKMTVLFLLLAASGALYLLIRKDRKEFMTGACYALCGVAAVFAIILSPVPVVYDRSMFGAALFVIAAIALYINGVLDETGTYRAAAAAAACLVLFSALIYAKGLAGMVYTHYLYEQRENYIREQKAAGNLNPVIPYLDNEFITDMDPLLAGDVSHYRRFWMNEAFAYHHGLESVQAVEAEKWHRLYEHGDPALMNITDLDQYLSTAENRNDIILLINSTVLDRETYSGLLRILNVHGILTDENVSTFSTIYDSGIVAESTGDTSSWLETVYYDHYFYLQGSADPVFSDIVVDGTEYSIDSSGITIVAYDPVKGYAVDSVTWNPESDQGGIRFKAE
ncbi:MAG: hypothetical protein IKF51_06535, partial [Solobacterium sp.]|nr:hypothetical protein [Solobacterium sp.]